MKWLKALFWFVARFVQILQIKAVDKITVFSLFMIYVLLPCISCAFLLTLHPRFPEPAIDINRENVLFFLKQVLCDNKYYNLKEGLFLTCSKAKWNILIILSGLEITADHRSMIGRKLLLIGKEGKLPFILIGKKYICLKLETLDTPICG